MLPASELDASMWDSTLGFMLGYTTDVQPT
jgi:hypothetical protein